MKRITQTRLPMRGYNLVHQETLSFLHPISFKRIH
jgi:hypothetical protein